MVINIKIYDDINLKELEFLGSGTQGRVYKIDSKKCIKVFKKKSACKDELHSLLMAQCDSHFPKIYSYGEKYIVRQYIDGVDLEKYLSCNILTKEISMKIIELYKSMKWVGYKRLDCALFHIFLSNDNKEIKLIDTAKAMKTERTYPSILIHELDKVGAKETFLRHTAESDINLYRKWIKNGN